MFIICLWKPSSPSAITALSDLAPRSPRYRGGPELTGQFRPATEASLSSLVRFAPLPRRACAHWSDSPRSRGEPALTGQIRPATDAGLSSLVSFAPLPRRACAHWSVSPRSRGEPALTLAAAEPVHTVQTVRLTVSTGRQAAERPPPRSRRGVMTLSRGRDHACRGVKTLSQWRDHACRGGICPCCCGGGVAGGAFCCATMNSE